MNHSHPIEQRPNTWKEVNSTRLFVVIQGTIGGLVGIVHGIFEILLGNRPTAGLVLDSKTGAFSILPTYLLSGIASVIIGLVLIFWTNGFIQRKNGPVIFLIICILLFLAGGGIAQVGFFLIAWGVAMHIHRPPHWWKNDVSRNTRNRLAKGWPAIFLTSYLFLFTGIAIWLIATPPGTSFRENVVAYLICWSCLAIGLVFQILTVVSGFARDIERQEEYAASH